ncbi:MAG: hypothetical protein N2109_06255 [Fimbriimonadales bacterium]|nr:hypothetical protein [Fimbriimonadales bacterium]
MGRLRWARIAVVLAQEDAGAPYYVEALQSGGVPHAVWDGFDASRLAECTVLLLCGYGSLGPSATAALGEWVRQGGAVVCSGSTWGLSGLLALEPRMVHLSNALLEPSEVGTLWPDAAKRMRCFGGSACAASGAEVVARVGDLAAVARSKPGSGLALFVGPHVGQTMALMQTGRSVETDGIGPADGTVRLDDGDLKAEDGIALSFDDDRASLGGAPFFAFPHADAVRDLWLGAVVEAATFGGRCLAVTWPWPDLAPGVVTASIEASPEAAGLVVPAMGTLSTYGLPAAWLVKPPGFPAEAVRSIRAREHEIGLLAPMDRRSPFVPETFRVQFVQLSRSALSFEPVSVRPENGRWRGHLAMLAAYEVSGARVDLSKGGRQAGCAGFAFGTCRPFHPLAANGAPSLVLEVPYQAYRPGIDLQPEVVDALLAQTLAFRGCLQLVWGIEDLLEPAVQEACRRVSVLARGQRLERLTPERIYRFERARRALKRFETEAEDGLKLVMASDTGVERLGLAFFGPGRLVPSQRGRELPTAELRAFGRNAQALVVNLPEVQMAEFSLRSLG